MDPLRVLSVDDEPDLRRLLEVRLEATPDELRLLRGALLAARASELAEVRRRSARHSFGYGDAGHRATMSDEARQAQRRHDLLDRLIAALTEAAQRAT